jgi:diacylglycerol kinase (ATP)
MRKAALLYNSDSGGGRARRRAELETVLAMLRKACIECELFLPTSRAHAEEHARQAVLEGCDVVFACGGDGTIHNVIQVLANTSVVLAILPMGTANALAHDLGLPMDVVKAARTALDGVPRRVALGKISFSDTNGNAGSRFFVVAAGAGVDAHLFYKLHARHKQRMGMAAYYRQAWHLWFSHRMRRFQVEFRDAGSREKSAQRQADVTELLAVRVRNFGGVLRELAPGASLDRNDLRLVICKTERRLAYLAYVVRGMLGVDWKIPGMELVHTERVSCHYFPDARPTDGVPASERNIYIEADGELVGSLPAEITVVPDALTLLAPQRC